MLGDFLVADSSVKAHFDDFSMPLIELSKTFHNFVQSEDRTGAVFDRNLHVVDRKMNRTAAAFRRAVRAGVIDQNLAHQARGDAEKMPAVLPVDAGLLAQTHKS